MKKNKELILLTQLYKINSNFELICISEECQLYLKEENKEKNEYILKVKNEDYSGDDEEIEKNWLEMEFQISKKLNFCQFINQYSKYILWKNKNILYLAKILIDEINEKENIFINNIIKYIILYEEKITIKLNKEIAEDKIKEYFPNYGQIENLQKFLEDYLNKINEKELENKMVKFSKNVTRVENVINPNETKKIFSGEGKLYFCIDLKLINCFPVNYITTINLYSFNLINDVYILSIETLRGIILLKQVFDKEPFFEIIPNIPNSIIMGNLEIYFESNSENFVFVFLDNYYYKNFISRFNKEQNLNIESGNKKENNSKENNNIINKEDNTFNNNKFDLSNNNNNTNLTNKKSIINNNIIHNNISNNDNNNIIQNSNNNILTNHNDNIIINNKEKDFLNKENNNIYNNNNSIKNEDNNKKDINIFNDKENNNININSINNEDNINNSFKSKKEISYFEPKKITQLLRNYSNFNENYDNKEEEEIENEINNFSYMFYEKKPSVLSISNEQFNINNEINKSFENDDVENANFTTEDRIKLSVQNYTYNQIYSVSENNRISIFQSDENDLTQIKSLIPISNSLGNEINIKHMYFFKEETNLLILDYNNPNTITQYDLNKNKLINEWKINHKNKINRLCLYKKFDQKIDSDLIYGITSNSMFLFNCNEGNIIEEKKYEMNYHMNSISSGINNEFAISTEKGEIRLYNKIGKALNLYSLNGDYIKNIDISNNGHLIVCTCDYQLIVFNVIGKNNLNGFYKRVSYENRNPGIYLKLKESDMKKYNLNGIKYNNGKFNINNENENDIICSIGKLVVIWCFNYGKYDKYKIFEMNDNTISSEYKYGKNQIVITMPKNISIKNIL